MGYRVPRGTGDERQRTDLSLVSSSDAAGSWLQTMLSVELFMMLKVEGWILFE